jgi:Xaa-Pro aminopeptidase
MKLPEFQNYLQEEALDLTILIHPDPALTYFTQQELSYGVILIRPGRVKLLMTKLDDEPALRGVEVEHISPDWEKKVVFNGQKIGVNKNQLSVSNLEKLKKSFPQARFVDVSKKIRQLRMQKTTHEIRQIAKACQITDNALAALIKEFPQGNLRTEQDVAFYLEKKIKEEGAGLAFPTIVASGKNGSVPHHVTSNAKLGSGFLQLDFGARYNNYCADMSRVLYLGKPTQKELEFYGVLQRAQQEGVDQIKENRTFSRLDKAARQKLGKYSSYFIHSLGHGIGVEVHEGPTFSEKGQKVMQNQVFTIEPGIYFPGKFGLRIEDTVVFEGQTKVLTKSSKELVIIKHKPFK